MEPDVKPRRYDSPRRRAQAAETRRAIVEAAARLFEAQGYAPTSVPMIAAAANVATTTVYVTFGTKATLLRAALEARSRGAELGTPAIEREWFHEFESETDPVAKLGIVAAMYVRVRSVSGRLLEVVRTAAVTDAEIASVWTDAESVSLQIQTAVVDELGKRRSLAPNVDRRQAIDTILALAHPTVWHLLVCERGWSDAEYETWLHDAYCFHLLRRDPRAPMSARHDTGALTS
jgi:AcrR family transcriptional regulator